MDLLDGVVRGDVASWPAGLGLADQSAFIEAAEREKLLPLIAYQLREVRVSDGWPHVINIALETAARKQAVSEWGRELELSRVLQALTDRGVQPVLIKGAALAYTCYPEPSMRSRTDTDFIIRRTDVGTTTSVMGARGYRKANTLAGEVASHQALFFKTDATGFYHEYDVHWKICNRPGLADFLTFDELLADAVSVPSLGVSARAPGLVHALLLACVHPVVHHRNQPRLHWLFDIHLLSRQLTPDLWEQFVTLAGERRIRAICEESLHLATTRLNALVPGEVMDRLAVDGHVEPSAAYLRSAAWRGDIRLSDLRFAPGWRAKLGLVREVVFPGTDFIMRAYGTTSKALVPALCVHRLIRGTWRLARRFIGDNR